MNVARPAGWIPRDDDFGGLATKNVARHSSALVVASMVVGSDVLNNLIQWV